MSMKGDGKPVSFIEDCAVPLEHLAEYTDAAHRGVPQARHRGHVVRARVGRLPARASGAQHEGRRRAAHARDRRRSGRAGAPLQGRVLRRARRRPRALRVDRAVLRRRGSRARSARSSRGSIRKGLMNPGKIVDPPKKDDRTLFRFKPGYRAAAARRRARLERVGRLRPARSRCATTTATAASSTPARCARPIAPRATSAPHARARQHAAPRDVGPARAARTSPARRCARRSSCASSCKGCKRECPTGRRHGAHEDRVPAAVQAPQRLHAARPARGPPAALRALGGAAAAAARAWREASRRAAHWWRRSPASTGADRCRSGERSWHREARTDGAAAGRARGRAVRRHLQQLASSPETSRPPRACSRPPAIASSSRAAADGAPAVLRPHLSRQPA